MQQAQKDLFHVQNFAKVVLRTEQVKQVMKLGIVNLATKFSLTWMSRLTKNESHQTKKPG
jgi:hypothetical protein